MIVQFNNWNRATVSDIIPNQHFILSVGAANAAVSGAGTSNPSSGEGVWLVLFL